MTEIYKDGDTFAIKTDAPDEHAFLNQMAVLISTSIENGEFMNSFATSPEPDGDLDVQKITEIAWSNDWEFQLNYIFPLMVDICCKYRGYKSSVIEKKVILAGTIMPDASKLFGVSEPR